MEGGLAARKLVAAGVGLAAVASVAALLYLRRAPNQGEALRKGTQNTVGAAISAAEILAPAADVQAPARPPPPARAAAAPAEEPVTAEQRTRAMELLQMLKQRANVAFQEGRYEDAVMGYQDCISVTSALGARDAEAVAAEQVIRANVVMAFIKLHQYADARLVATMLLQEDADRGCPVEEGLKVKVLYRRGLASKALGEKDAALADFRAAIQLSPGGKNAMAEREVTLMDGDFVVVRIVLSAICKVLEAVFDINGNQFTFHCRPYYLRLTFNEELQEGKGERAVYDLETNTLTVYLPKAVSGQAFTQLDNPAYLIATELQRKRLISVVSGTEPPAVAQNEEDEDEEAESEFVQTLADEAADAEVTAVVHYGFGNHFSGLFARLDPDVVREMVDVPAPESTLPQQRRAMRLEAENAAFDEEAVLVAFEDADGEVAQVLRYVPAHMSDFQRALQEDGILLATLPPSPETAREGPSAPQRTATTTTGEEEGLEEEETTLAAGGTGEVSIWQGNVAEFRRPLIQELNGSPEEAKLLDAPQPAPAAAGPVPTAPGRTAVAGTRLAIPRTRPRLTFCTEENEALLRFKAPRLLFPPSPEAVAALTVDLLLSEAYDDLVTEGQGCSESLWNLTVLSPALSFLDAPATVHEACVAFARRVLVYPLHRHWGLVQRAFAGVGTRLLLGRQYVVRALLRVRRVLAHAEHKHVLATIFLDPLIAYWMSVAEADDRLMSVAFDIHEDVTRTQPVAVRGTSKHGNAALTGGAAELLLSTSDAAKANAVLPPITPFTLGLPFDSEDGDGEEGQP